MTCGIFPDQGSNPCPLHWQADSQPLRHQGSPGDPFLLVHLLSQILWCKLGVYPSISVTCSQHWKHREGFQKIWQNWPWNCRIHTSPKFSPHLASGSPFLFPRPDFYLIAQTIVIARKEMKGQVVILALLPSLTSWPPFFWVFSSPCPRRHLRPKIALLPVYQFIFSFSPWFKHGKRYPTLPVIIFHDFLVFHWRYLPIIYITTPNSGYWNWHLLFMTKPKALVKGGAWVESSRVREPRRSALCVYFLKAIWG